ncbi:hypothetical protein GCM10027214_34240 [Stenotrophomonas tumulicola]
MFPGMTASPVRMSVIINGHWKGYSWLRIRDDGQPCALVSHWMEWGVASTASFAADSEIADHANCVQPQPAVPPDMAAATDAGAVESNSQDSDSDDDDDEPVVRRRYDAQRHQLNVRVKDELMSRARGDVPFSRYEDGVSAVRLDYQVNAAQGTRTIDGVSTRNDTVYATLNPGFNFGPWRARSTLNYARDKSLSVGGANDPRWTRDNTYLTRDIGKWRSRMLIGEGYTDSLLFASIPFTGARISSEDSLLPDYLEAFTPVVRGVANSNAEVLVRQGGVLFYHTSVAPGPFVLYDVRPPSSSGDIRVTVREADGTEHVSIVPYTAMPLLTHGKVWKYSVNAGQYRPLFGNAYPRDDFLQATAGYGLPYKLSAYVGALSSSGYESRSFGMGWDLDKGGALSLDVSRSRIGQAIAEAAGRQWRLRYAKSFATIGTGVSLDYRRFDAGHFRTLESLFARDEQVAFWRDLVGEEHADEWVTETKPRTQVRMELKQNVGDTGNLYATLTRLDYASDTRRRTSAQIGMTWYGSRFDLDVQANHNRVGTTGVTSAQFSLSIPLGTVRDNTLRYAVSADRDEEGGMTWNNRVAGSGMRDYRLNYVLNQQRAYKDSSKSADSVRVNYQADAASWGLGYTQGGGNRRADASLEGSIIGWPGGVVLGQPLGETVGIIDAPGFSDASIDGQMATRTDGRGRAVVSYLTPYRVNRLGLDSIKLGDDYDYDTLFREVVPTTGAVLVVPIKPEPMPAPLP